MNRNENMLVIYNVQIDFYLVKCGFVTYPE